MSRVLNYSAVINRKEKIYKFGNLTLSEAGLDFAIFKWVFLGVFIGFIFGSIISLITGTWKYWGEGFSLYFVIFTLGGGGALGFSLYEVRIGGYQLYTYLLAYFRKKQVYSHTSIRDVQVLQNRKVHTLVRKEV